MMCRNVIFTPLSTVRPATHASAQMERERRMVAKFFMASRMSARSQMRLRRR